MVSGAKVVATERGIPVPSNTIPLLQELRDDMGTSVARSTDNLHGEVHKLESQNRSRQEITDRLTKTSSEAISVKYRKKWVDGWPRGGRPGLSTPDWTWFRSINLLRDPAASHRPNSPVVYPELRGRLNSRFGSTIGGRNGLNSQCGFPRTQNPRSLPFGLAILPLRSVPATTQTRELL